MLALGTEYYLFAAAGVLSLGAFVGLILAPALGSYGRAWEKLVAGFLSLFVLAALVLIGLVIGVVIFLNWDEISTGSGLAVTEPTMSDDAKLETAAERHADPGSLEELSAAIESGAGMPAVARAAGACPRTPAWP